MYHTIFSRKFKNRLDFVAEVYLRSNLLYDRTLSRLKESVNTPFSKFVNNRNNKNWKVDASITEFPTNSNLFFESTRVRRKRVYCAANGSGC